MSKSMMPWVWVPLHTCYRLFSKYVFQWQASVCSCKVPCLLWWAVVTGHCVSIATTAHCNTVLPAKNVSSTLKLSVWPPNSVYWAHWCSGTPQVGLSGLNLDHIPPIVPSFVWLYPSRQMSGRPWQRPQPPPFKFLPAHYSWSSTLYNDNALDS